MSLGFHCFSYLYPGGEYNHFLSFWVLKGALEYPCLQIKVLMATSGGLAQVAALLERLGPAKGEPLGSDPPWKSRDPLVERLFAKEIFGTVSDRKRKLSEDSDDDIQDLPHIGEEFERGPVIPDKVDDDEVPLILE